MNFSIRISSSTKILALGLILAGLLTAPSFAQKTVKISGSVPFKEQYFDHNLDAIKEKSKLLIEVVGNGTDRGIADVIEGRSDAAMLAAPLVDIAKKMNEKKPGYVDIGSYKETKIGDIEIALVVNPSNGVKKLTAVQAIGLLSGTIKNWKDVGGIDQPVVVVVAMPGNGIRTTIEKQLLKDAPFSKEARQVTNPGQVITVVGQLPGAIGPVGVSMLESKVTQIKISDKKIIAPMILMTKGDPSAEILSIINILKNL